MHKKEEITYQLFGIDPAKFYSTRFLYEDVIDLPTEFASKAIINSIIYQKSQYLIDTIKKYGAKKVLDLGCGSGIFGGRVKYYCPGTKVYGVDLSDSCVNVTQRYGYDHAISHNVIEGLPYEDEMFDLVFSMDFFGHVEFKDKDKLIGEIQRVTRRGGFGFHGIETAYVDYYNCIPEDPEDAVRKYVYSEGHIGVETLEEIVKRFGRCFEILAAIPWPILPFINIDNVFNYNIWGKQFNDAVKPFFDYNARIISDVVLGYCSQYFTDLLTGIFGNILTEEKLKSLGINGLEKLVQGNGFSFITVQKPV